MQDDLSNEIKLLCLGRTTVLSAWHRESYYIRELAQEGDSARETDTLLTFVEHCFPALFM